MTENTKTLDSFTRFVALATAASTVTFGGLSTTLLSAISPITAVAQAASCNPSFSGQVLNYIVNIRSGRTLSSSVLRTVGPKVTLYFDGWDYGDTINDLWYGKPDNKWFKLKGENAWVASAVIWGNPPSDSFPLSQCPHPTSGKYYSELSLLTDDKWDEYSGDNTRFDPQSWDDGVDERYKTPASISQIYTDLSSAIFGSRRKMNTGYLYDQSYYSYYNKYHTGFDIAGSQGQQVKTVVSGAIYLIQNIAGNYFIAIVGDDGNLWIYGHLGSRLIVSNGTRVAAGQIVGTIGSQNHLHFEVQPGDTYKPTLGAYGDLQTAKNWTISPLQAFWKLKNR